MEKTLDIVAMVVLGIVLTVLSALFAWFLYIIGFTGVISLFSIVIGGVLFAWSVERIFPD